MWYCIKLSDKQLRGPWVQTVLLCSYLFAFIKTVNWTSAAGFALEESSLNKLFLNLLVVSKAFTHPLWPSSVDSKRPRIEVESFGNNKSFVENFFCQTNWMFLSWLQLFPSDESHSLLEVFLMLFGPELKWMKLGGLENVGTFTTKGMKTEIESWSNSHWTLPSNIRSIVAWVNQASVWLSITDQRSEVKQERHAAQDSSGTNSRSWWYTVASGLKGSELHWNVRATVSV